MGEIQVLSLRNGGKPIKRDSIYTGKEMIRAQYWIGLFLTGAVFAETGHFLDIRRPSRETSDLTGKVKSVEYDFCRNVSDKHTKSRTEYDETGNILNTTDWDDEGKISATSTNFYDEAGNWIGQLEIDGKKGTTNDWEIILRPDTRQIAMKSRQTGKITLRTYSPEKQLTETRSMDTDRKTTQLQRYTWQNGEKQEYTKFDEREKPVYFYFYKWNDNGSINKERVKYHQETKDRLHIYDYLARDEAGNWIQQLMVRYNIEGNEKVKEYEKITVRKIEYFEPAGGTDE